VAFASSVLSSPVELLPDTAPGRGLHNIIETAGEELQFPSEGWRLASLKPPKATPALRPRAHGGCWPLVIGSASA